jgi:LacI family transcriptional regulator
MKQTTKKTRVSINDVAKKAGVSPSLVSMVLNNRPNVKAETALNIKTIVKALGYKIAPNGKKPGPVAGKQMKSRKKPVSRLTIGVLQKQSMSLIPVYSLVNKGIEQSVTENHCDLIYKHFDSETECENAFHRPIDGLIYFVSEDDYYKCKPYFKITKSVKVMGMNNPLFEADQITYDNNAIGLVAANYCLLQNKFNSFVGLSYRYENDMFCERARGFFERIKAQGKKSYLFDKTTSETSLEDIIAQINNLPKPIALFCVMDALTVEIYQLLYQIGLKPGAEIEVVSCNKDVALLNNLRPRPASVDIHSEAIGQQAVHQLLWRIRHPEEPIAKILLHPKIVLGNDYGMDQFA